MKVKLTIYNTLLMSVLVAVVLGFMMSVSGTVVKVSSEATLKSVVTENASEIEYERNQLDLSDVEFYEDQVTTLIYSTEGVLLAGSMKHEILEPLINGQMKTVIISGDEYMIYDFLATSNRGDDVYVRGVISITSATNMLNNLFRIALLAFPLFILCSALGSYWICKKSLLPLMKMVETAENISTSDDLSLRIGETKGKDEIARLAVTFDGMLSRVEQIMIAERQFTSDVSHELRTPVAVILGECEVAEQGSETEKADALKQVKNQALNIKVLISHLLNMIRLESGLQKPELSEVDLSELVEDFCEEKRSTLPEHVQLNVGCQPEIILRSDYSMLLRILTNLLENSLKYLGDGQQIDITLAEQNDAVVLSVQDDGIGISQEEISLVFGKFYRVDKSRAEEKSMGLGLSMVKQMVELLGGEITLESQLSKGSIFTIQFKKDEG